MISLSRLKPIVVESRIGYVFVFNIDQDLLVKFGMTLLLSFTSVVMVGILGLILTFLKEHMSMELETMETLLL